MQLHEENQNSGFKNIPMNFSTIVGTFNDSFYDTCTREPKYIYAALTECVKFQVVLHTVFYGS